MIWLTYIVGSIYGLIFIFELFLIIRFRINKPKWGAFNDWPKVTLLVCARNEEHNLERCFNTLLNLDYPKDRMTILVGNDNSEDQTGKIITEYSAKHTFINGLSIIHEKDGLIAKGNVLYQLIEKSKDEYLVIIDADMAVSDLWLKTMVSALTENDMVSGYTQIDEGANWSLYQFFDWQIVLHSMKSMADTFRPISILGNNMGFKRSTYYRVGGFKGLGPTDVEDLGLLQRFQQSGAKTAQLIVESGFAKTLPQPNFKELIFQRCRWMNGVFTHHWVLGIPAFFARLWLPIGALTFIFTNQLGLGILLYGILINLIKYIQISTSTGSFKKFTPLTPAVISLLDTFALIRILFKGKVSWKGRKF